MPSIAPVTEFTKVRSMKSPVWPRNEYENREQNIFP